MNLNKIINQYFAENEFDKIADRILVLRNDGISVYSNYENKFEVATIGALTSGLWQAAQSLSALVGGEKDFFEFRLGFDTTADGLYIMPLQILGDMYYICVIHTDTDNPGKLKQSIKRLRASLELYLSEFSLDADKNREEYLFDNISDTEMDKLFQPSGI